MKISDLNKEDKWKIVSNIFNRMWISDGPIFVLALIFLIGCFLSFIFFSNVTSYILTSFLTSIIIIYLGLRYISLYNDINKNLEKYKYARIGLQYQTGGSTSLSHIEAKIDLHSLLGGNKIISHKKLKNGTIEFSSRRDKVELPDNIDWLGKYGSWQESVGKLEEII